MTQLQKIKVCRTPKHQLKVNLENERIEFFNKHFSSQKKQARPLSSNFQRSVKTVPYQNFIKHQPILEQISNKLQSQTMFQKNLNSEFLKKEQSICQQQFYQKLSSKQNIKLQKQKTSSTIQDYPIKFEQIKDNGLKMNYVQNIYKFVIKTYQELPPKKSSKDFNYDSPAKKDL